MFVVVFWPIEMIGIERPVHFSLILLWWKILFWFLTFTLSETNDIALAETTIDGVPSHKHTRTLTRAPYAQACVVNVIEWNVVRTRGDSLKCLRFSLVRPRDKFCVLRIPHFCLYCAWAYVFSHRTKTINKAERELFGTAPLEQQQARNLSSAISHLIVEQIGHKFTVIHSSFRK